MASRFDNDISIALSERDFMVSYDEKVIMREILARLIASRARTGISGACKMASGVSIKSARQTRALDI